MPLRLPRRTLAAEITLSLIVKALALAAIAILLFGPGQRPSADADHVAEVLTGGGHD